MKFDQVNPHLGAVKYGEVKEFTFEFTNTGDTTFTVENMTGGCSCTEILDYTKRVQPKQKGKIKVKFDSNKADIKDKYNSSVEIFGNVQGAIMIHHFTVDVKK